jgi:hypothetical protein
MDSDAPPGFGFLDWRAARKTKKADHWVGLCTGNGLRMKTRSSEGEGEREAESLPA